MPDVSRRQVLGIAGGAALVAATGIAGGAPASAQSSAQGGSAGFSPPPAPVPVPLTDYFDNDGVDTASVHDGNFDGSGYTFPGEQVPSGSATVAGVPYVLGSSAAGAQNTVVAVGQRIAIPQGRYLNALFLTACSYGSTGGTATVHYADGST